MTKQNILLKLDNSNNVDLSVIIPIYIDTIKFQNLLNSYFLAFQDTGIKYEIIVIDNNSPNIDSIVDIVLKSKNKIEITFISQPKLKHPFSLCSARNRGALNARGNYLFFTDADCLVDEALANSLAGIINQSTLLQPEKDTKIFTGERVFVRVPNTPLLSDGLMQAIKNLERVPSASNYGKVKDRRFPWIEKLPHQEHPWNFVHGCFVFMKKSDYLSVGGSDTSYDGHWGYEEIDLIYRMVMALGACIYYLPNAKVYHQEFDSDLEKITNNVQRSNKSLNPNYLRICDRIHGFDDFKKKQWEALSINTQ